MAGDKSADKEIRSGDAVEHEFSYKSPTTCFWDEANAWIFLQMDRHFLEMLNPDSTPDSQIGNRIRENLDLLERAFGWKCEDEKDGV